MLYMLGMVCYGMLCMYEVVVVVVGIAMQHSSSSSSSKKRGEEEEEREEKGGICSYLLMVFMYCGILCRKAPPSGKEGG